MFSFGGFQARDLPIYFQKILISYYSFLYLFFRYEVLKDDEQREEYNYMLDHPEEMYSNYYRYYRRRFAPKVDIRIVIAVTLSVISGIQYYSA